MGINGTSPAFTYDQQPHYHHTPLVNPLKCFRLFQLYPLQEDGVIRGSTDQYAIDNPPQYIALSYEWGSALDPHWIEVDGSRFQIRSNLLNILTECVRRKHIDQSFFIDAVCIDQSNSGERNAQVRLMSRIYRESLETSVWLNANVPYMEGLLNFLTYLQDNPRLPHIRFTNFRSDGAGRTIRHGATDNSIAQRLHPMFTRTQYLPSGEEICVGRNEGYGIRMRHGADFRCLTCELMELLKATYWSRIWVVPEFILGRQTSINCGRSVTTSRTLKYAISVLISFRDDIFLDASSRDMGPHVLDPVGLKLIRMKELLQNMKDNTAIDIMYWFDRSGAQYCADDKDRLYSLLGLDAACGNFPVDYTHSRLRVFLDLALFLEQKKGDIESIDGKVNSIAEATLVSWNSIVHCHPLSRVFGLHASVQSSEVKREIQELEAELGYKAYCDMGKLSLVRPDTWTRYPTTFVRHPQVVTVGNSDSSDLADQLNPGDRILDLYPLEYKEYWFQKYCIGVLFQLHDTTWEAKGVCVRNFSRDKYSWDKVDDHLHKITCLGNVRLDGEEPSFELELPAVVDLFLLVEAAGL